MDKRATKKHVGGLLVFCSQKVHLNPSFPLVHPWPRPVRGGKPLARSVETLGDVLAALRQAAGLHVVSSCVRALYPVVFVPHTQESPWMSPWQWV